MLDSRLIKFDDIVSFVQNNPNTNLMETTMGTVCGFQVKDQRLMVLIKNTEGECLVDYSDITSVGRDDVVNGVCYFAIDELETGVIYKLAGSENRTYYLNDNGVPVCRENGYRLEPEEYGLFYKA